MIYTFILELKIKIMIERDNYEYKQAKNTMSYNRFKQT